MYVNIHIAEWWLDELSYMQNGDWTSWDVMKEAIMFYFWYRCNCILNYKNMVLVGVAMFSLTHTLQEKILSSLAKHIFCIFWGGQKAYYCTNKITFTTET